MSRPFNKKFLLLADQAVFSGSSFVVTVVLARMLSVQDFGTFAGLILVLYLIVSLVNAFVIHPLQVTLPSVGRTTDYLSFSLWFQSGITILLTTGISLLLLMPLPALQMLATLYLPILLFSAGFLMQDYFRKRLLAENRIEQTLLADILLMVAHAGALLIMATNPGVTLENTITGLGIGYILPVLYLLMQSDSMSYPNKRWFVYAKAHIVQGKWLFFTAVLQWWAGNFFVVASGLLLGSAALGALRLVQSVFGVLNILFQTFENYLLPQTAGKMQISLESGIGYLKKSSRQPMLFAAILLTAMFVLSDTIIVLAGGENYRDYGFLVKGMAVLYVFIFVGYPVRIAIRALIMNKVFFEGYLLTFMFALSSSWLLLTRFELIGAIVGLILSQIILLVYWQIKLMKKHILLWK
jgi:O-antigen/teichoic acid export membrane protein